MPPRPSATAAIHGFRLPIPHDAELHQHISALADAHVATAISYAGGPAWADGTTNPVSNVEAQLDKIIQDLSSGAGAEKIAYNGGPSWANSNTNPATTLGAEIDKIISDLAGTTTGASGTEHVGGRNVTNGAVNIPAGTLHSQLVALLSAANLTYGGGPTWADGSTNPTTTVEGQLDKIVGDLASTTTSGSGSRKVGVESLDTWLGGRTNPAGTLYNALNRIIDDLGNSSVADDGAIRIGAARSNGGTGDLLIGSVRSQLDSLAVDWAKPTRSITWSGSVNTWLSRAVFNNAGNTSPVIESTDAPTTSQKKLLMEFAVNTMKARVYVEDLAGFSAALWLTINAYWNGAAWAADDTSLLASAVTFQDSIFQYLTQILTGSPWTVWNRFNQFLSGEEFTAGVTTQVAYVGVQDRSSPSSSDTIGVGVNYRCQFSSTPSSYTYTEINSSDNIGSDPTPYSSHTSGTGTVLSTTTTLSAASTDLAFWYGYVTVNP